MISAMIDNIKNKIDVRLDYAQPVYLDNFAIIIQPYVRT